jgi:hypothetical protein
MSKKTPLRQPFSLFCLILGIILTYLTVFYPAMIILAIVFILIGTKGILVYIL